MDIKLKSDGAGLVGELDFPIEIIANRVKKIWKSAGYTSQSIQNIIEQEHSKSDTHPKKCQYP